jgi:hypothetical protein
MERGNVRQPVGRDAKPTTALARVDGRICLVCAETAEDLICTGCRARIQGEALEQRREEKRRAPG